MSKPIHVLQMVDSLGVGGAERLVYELTCKLVSDGFRVSVCYCEPGPLANDLTGMGVAVKHIPWRARVDPMLLMRMIKTIRQDPPQIVHTHLFKSDFHGRLAARLSGVPVVISTLHSCNEWARDPFLGFTYGMTAGFANRIIAVAEEVRDFAVHHFHISMSRIVTIANGVDIKRFVGNEAIGGNSRAELGIAQDAPLIGIVARLDPPKDHATFLQAAALIRNAAPDARFLVVGDGQLREPLMKLASDLGLDKAVIFAGMRNDVPNILAALDILVLCSVYEGLPMALLEGMAAARPIVSTAVGGVPGLVIEGQTGLLVPPADAKALADACLRLIANPALRRKMGRAGFVRAQERYSLDEMNARIVGLYTSLLEQSGVVQHG